MKKVSFHDIVQHERFNTKVITYNELTHSPEAAYQNSKSNRLMPIVYCGLICNPKSSNN